jgi:hypothetical protein
MFSPDPDLDLHPHLIQKRYAIYSAEVQIQSTSTHNTQIYAFKICNPRVESRLKIPDMEHWTLGEVSITATTQVIKY